jgi:hypothetical protein
MTTLDGLKLLAVGVSLILANACTSTESSVPASGSPAPPTAASPLTSGFDCAPLYGGEPDIAERTLEAAGHEVIWRAVHTQADGTTVADAVTEPPPGVVVDIVFSEEGAFVFVALEDDPAAQSPGPVSC